MAEVLPIKSEFHLLNTPALAFDDNKIQTTPFRINAEYQTVQSYLKYTQLKPFNDSAISVELLRIEKIIFEVNYGRKDNSLIPVTHTGIKITETDMGYNVSTMVVLEDGKPHEFTFSTHRRDLELFGVMSLKQEVGVLTTPEYTITPIAYVALIQFKDYK